MTRLNFASTSTLNISSAHYDISILQRYSSIEQGYNDLQAKYKELSSTKTSIEKSYIHLQSLLEEERRARGDSTEHIKDMESKIGLLIMY